MLFDGSTVSAWRYQAAAADRVTSVPDPDGAGDSALRFTAYDGDVYPLTPTDNPRAQLITPSNIITYGQAFWESYEVYVPPSFPVAQTHGGWLGLGSPLYGAPFTAEPTTGISLIDGQIRFQLNRLAPQPYQIEWQEPIVTGTWIRITWHILPSMAGYTQLFVNDQPVSLPLPYGVGSSTTLPMSTIDAGSSNGPWYSQLSVYYKAGEYTQATLYFKGFKIGTTQAAVES